MLPGDVQTSEVAVQVLGARRHRRISNPGAEISLALQLLPPISLSFNSSFRVSDGKLAFVTESVVKSEERLFPATQRAGGTRGYRRKLENKCCNVYQNVKVTSSALNGIRPAASARPCLRGGRGAV